MELIKLSELFNITYGTKFDMNKMTILKGSSVPFVSRTSKNNGIANLVEIYKDTKPLKSGQITVSLGGTYVLSSFLQEQDFYTGQNVGVLESKTKMSREEKLYYCMAITKNRFRYGAFGREANRTLKDILLPATSEIPQWVKNGNFSQFDKVKNPFVEVKEEIIINPIKWEDFKYDEIFDIKKGFYNKKPPTTEDNNSIPFIGATEYNNGITGKIKLVDIEQYSKTGKIEITNTSLDKLFKANCITVTNNGSVGNAFYQDKEFTCSHDVNPLYLLNHKLNKFIAMFLITLIELEKYRWGYGRKWRPTRMPESLIRLPVLNNGNPDWEYMENYIKQCSFSKSI